MKKITKEHIKLINASLMIGAIFAIAYPLARTSLYIFSDYTWYEKVLSALLLFSEIFIAVHGIGYILEVVHIINANKSLLPLIKKHTSALKKMPPVAIVIPSYKEPLDVLRNTLICCKNLNYENKQIYLLDDTRYDLGQQGKMEQYQRDLNDLCEDLGVYIFRRIWRGAKAGIINDFLDFLQGTQKEGSTCTHSQQETVKSTEYMAVFDADQNPFPDFLLPLVTSIEENPSLAFIQTPQYYINFEKNRIAYASGMLQTVFYEYICSGKSLNNATFCCGTNVLFRIKALLSVGGFEEESVTEDFATSLKFHLEGWESMYYPEASAFGTGPEDLGNYFKQQYRWSRGTLGMLKSLFKAAINYPRKLSLIQWWEYFLSCTHYLIGFVFLIFTLCPMIYLLFNIPIYLAKPIVFFVFFTPYLLFSLLSFYTSLAERGYQAKDLIAGQCLLAITFPVYIKAAIAALFNKKNTFEVTRRKKGSSLSAQTLWPQFSLIFLTIVAISWGINKIYYGQGDLLAVVLNTLWCIYNCAMLCSVQYFNDPARKGT